MQLIPPWTWSFSIRTFQVDKGLTWEREKGIQTSKPQFPAFPSFPVTKIAGGHLLEQRVPWRFSDEHGRLLGSFAMGKTLLFWWHIWSMGRCLASFPEAVFQTQGWLVMGPQGCPGGLTGDFGFHSPPPLLWTSCSFLSTHNRHLLTYLLIPPCLLSRTHQRPCLLKVKKEEKRKEKFCFCLYFNFLTKKLKILLLIKMIPLFLKSLWYWHLHYVFLRKVTSLSQQWTWSSAAWTSSKCAMKWPEMALGWDISEINRRPRCFKEVSFSCPLSWREGWIYLPLSAWHELSGKGFFSREDKRLLLYSVWTRFPTGQPWAHSMFQRIFADCILVWRGGLLPDSVFAYEEPSF